MMRKEGTNRVCPVEHAGILENPLRRLLQNPKKILAPFLEKGMTILDLGCGPGFFTIEMAKMLDNSCKIIAADLQEGMLEKVSQKIKGTQFEQSIELHLCQSYRIGIKEKVDFILAFYLIHEVTDQDSLFEELKSILKPNGKIFIVEPCFHVSRESFEVVLNKIKSFGFDIVEMPKIFFSRAVVLKKSSG